MSKTIAKGDSTKSTINKPIDFELEANKLSTINDVSKIVRSALFEFLKENRTYISNTSIFQSTSTLTKEEETKEKELSNYVITKDGVVNDAWDFIQHIPSRILEIQETHVILECLLDEENKVFQNRKFEKYFFENQIPLIQFQPVMIKIFKRPTESKIKFYKGDGLFDVNIFHVDFTSELPDKLFSKKL